MSSGPGVQKNTDGGWVRDMMENQAKYNRQVAGVQDPPQGTYGDTWTGGETPPSRPSAAKNPVTRPQMRNENENMMSPEEQQLLSDCSRTATMQRGLPMAFLVGIATKAGIDRGLLIPHPRFGAIPKIVAAGTLAYL